MAKIQIYDPPNGWKYGFPKEYSPSNPLEPLEVTLRRDGYPEKELALGVKYCRFWWTESEDEQ